MTNVLRASRVETEPETDAIEPVDLAATMEEVRRDFLDASERIRVEVPAGLRFGLLKQAVRHVVDCHEALHSGFIEEDGEIVMARPAGFAAEISLTRADGRYDLAVNGGGTLIVHLEKSGYIPVDRIEEVPWNRFVVAEDVVMVSYDPAVSTIVLGSAGAQVARGSVVVDEDGARQATLIFQPGTTATMTLTSGGTQPLPVARSSTRQGAAAGMRSTAASTRVSVSGRGISTAGVTLNDRP